jgi:hypothetical protein
MDLLDDPESTTNRIPGATADPSLITHVSVSRSFLRIYVNVVTDDVSKVLVEVVIR